jgi:hypothetical protein
MAALVHAVRPQSRFVLVKSLHTLLYHLNAC